MDKKQIELLSKKMKATQILFDLVPIIYYGGPGIKYEAKLGITNEMFYFIHNNHIKKQILVGSINMATVSAYSQEIVLHCQDDDIRLCSFQNAKIFKNILKVRQKVLNNQEEFTVLLEKQKSLSKYAGQEEQKRGFFSTLFGRHNHEKSRTGSTSSNRNSYCKIMVEDNSFLREISRNIYECRCQHTQILYIGGNHCFYFDQDEYSKEQIDKTSDLFENSFNKEQYLMRKIKKENKDSSAIIRNYLENYRFKCNQEQILYATESKSYFKIISPFTKHQKDIEYLLVEESFIKQIDLVSIFYKLMGLIEEESNIFHSLRPKYIIMKENINIATVMCINSCQNNMNYIAPEELDPSIAISIEAELINFWKIGILLYQAAFLKEPFPIEHLAELVAHSKPLKLYFPSSRRTPEFKQFLGQILLIQPQMRGGNGWRKKIFEHRWIKQTMR